MAANAFSRRPIARMGMRWNVFIVLDKRVIGSFEPTGMERLGPIFGSRTIKFTFVIQTRANLELELERKRLNGCRFHGRVERWGRHGTDQLVLGHNRARGLY